MKRNGQLKVMAWPAPALPQSRVVLVTVPQFHRAHLAARALERLHELAPVGRERAELEATKAEVVA